jgi:hypothetical protein
MRWERQPTRELNTPLPKSGKRWKGRGKRRRWVCSLPSFKARQGKRSDVGDEFADVIVEGVLIGGEGLER